MKSTSIRSGSLVSTLANVISSIILLVAVVAGSSSPASARSLLGSLLGSWGGSGTFQLRDGVRERISCNAYYTGGGSQLRLAIRCRSDTNKIEIRSRLSENAGNLSGTWEERTYNAEGNATGRITGQNMRLNIRGGGISASMSISFSSSRQKISISVTGVALKSVKISLSRR